MVWYTGKIEWQVILSIQPSTQLSIYPILSSIQSSTHCPSIHPSIYPSILLININGTYPDNSWGIHGDQEQGPQKVRCHKATIVLCGQCWAAKPVVLVEVAH
jgi:hypothetical protein